MPSILLPMSAVGLQTLMSIDEDPLHAGRKAGRVIAEDRRRRGASGCAGLPLEKMRAVFADYGVMPSQGVRFLRGFWHGVITG